MPVGKELSSYKGAFTSVRNCETNGAEDKVEGCYTAKVSGEIKGTAVGTMTFRGSNGRGLLSDIGAGYLDSGEVVPYKAHVALQCPRRGSTRMGLVASSSALCMKPGDAKTATMRGW
ncbi:MAG: hypothetical protein O3C28_09325 [Proteobacteria bacterium]|nr:hypothetical protein [Pseudomonadota bacterium]